MAGIKYPTGFNNINFQRYYQTTPCARGRMRCLAMVHLQKGKSIKEVSEIIQQSRVAISQWLGWLREENGLERITGYVKGRGRKTKLSGVDDETIRRTIEQASETRNGGRMTGREIQQIIKEKWNVDYALSSVYTLLDRLNLVWITARSRHPLMNSATQEEFKKKFR
jgi:transposase